MAFSMRMDSFKKASNSYCIAMSFVSFAFLPSDKASTQSPHGSDPNGMIGAKSNRTRRGRPIFELKRR